MKRFLIGLLIVAGAGYGYFRYKFPTYSWHQKITVEVQTPAGIKSGFSVQAATLFKSFSLGSGGYTGGNSLRGEAVVVEVAPQKYLFLLLSTGDNLAQYVVLDKSMLSAPLEERGAQLEEVGRKGEVPPDRYPLLVTFKDITRPETVERVYPHHFNDAFGEGYAIKSVTLEITEEPVTEGRVENVLGWWKNRRKVLGLIWKGNPP